MMLDLTKSPAYDFHDTFQDDFKNVYIYNTDCYSCSRGPKCDKIKLGKLNKSEAMRLLMTRNLARMIL